MDNILANNLFYILLALAVGTALAAVSLATIRRRKYWLAIDQSWIVLGGFGTLLAVFIGVYRGDESRINRQIDAVYTNIETLRRDQSRFRLRYCQARPVLPADAEAVKTLCEKVELAQASAVINERLQLFTDVADFDRPLRSANFLNPTMDDEREMAMMVQEMRSEALSFNPDDLLIVDTDTPETRAAIDQLRESYASVGPAADYQVLAQTYAELTENTIRLKRNFEFLDRNRSLLVIQLLAIMAVAFALPLRIGKGIYDIFLN